MFKAINENKIIAICENNYFPMMIFSEIIEDKEHTLNDFLQVSGEYLLKTDSRAIEQMQSDVRAVRNRYLVEYVDGIVSNPLRWADMSEEEQGYVTTYRRYLLNYTDNDGWWNSNPKTFSEWKENV